MAFLPADGGSERGARHSTVGAMTAALPTVVAEPELATAIEEY
jgi:hypothetical protein